MGDLFVDEKGAVVKLVVDGEEEDFRAWCAAEGGVVDVNILFDQSGGGFHMAATFVTLERYDGELCAAFSPLSSLVADGGAATGGGVAATPAALGVDGASPRSVVFSGTVRRRGEAIQSLVTMGDYEVPDGEFGIRLFQLSGQRFRTLRLQTWGANDIDACFERLDRPHTFAATYDGDEMALHIDGEKASSRSGVLLNTSGSSPLRVGQWGSAAHFEGRLTSLLVYATPSPALPPSLLALSSIPQPEVVAAEGGCLDGMNVYTSAVGAYSLRRLFGEYRGPAVRLRRSTDGALADVWMDRVGRVRMVRDVATSAFLRADVVGWLGRHDVDGFVVTWYDQSSHARDAVQGDEALQPRLVMTAEEGRPALIFASGCYIQPASLFGPFNATGMSTYQRFVPTTVGYINIYDSNIQHPMLWIDASGRLEFNEANLLIEGSVVDKEQSLSYTHLTTGANRVWVNGKYYEASLPNMSSAQAVRMFNRGGGQTFVGRVYDSVFFSTTLTTTQLQELTARMESFTPSGVTCSVSAVDGEYGGPQLRVTRMSDWTEADVTTDQSGRVVAIEGSAAPTLEEWCRGSPLRVARWYDQSTLPTTYRPAAQRDIVPRRGVQRLVFVDNTVVGVEFGGGEGEMEQADVYQSFLSSNYLGPCSFEFWLCTGRLSASSPTLLVTDGAAEGGTVEWQPSSMRFQWEAGASTPSASFTSSQGQWTHVVATHEPTGAYRWCLYANASLLAEAARDAEAGQGGPSTRLVVGKRLEGLVRAVRVYDRALHASEVSARHQQLLAADANLNLGIVRGVTSGAYPSMARVSPTLLRPTLFFSPSSTQELVVARRRRVDVCCVGGGAGGSSDAGPGGGGGGEVLTSASRLLLHSSILSITAGEGGAAGRWGGDAQIVPGDGGATSVVAGEGWTVTANGGKVGSARSGGGSGGVGGGGGAGSWWGSVMALPGEGGRDGRSGTTPGVSGGMGTPGAGGSGAGFSTVPFNQRQGGGGRWRTVQQRRWPPNDAIRGGEVDGSGTVYTRTVAGEAYGNGVYTVRASAADRFDAADRRFWTLLHADEATTAWHGAEPLSYDSSGAYTGSTETTYDGGSATGQWVEVQMPHPVEVATYRIVARLNWVQRAPRKWLLLGSADGQAWHVVDAREGYTTAVWQARGVADAGGHEVWCSIPFPEALQYYRFILQEGNPNFQHLHFFERVGDDRFGAGGNSATSGAVDGIDGLGQGGSAVSFSAAMGGSGGRGAALIALHPPEEGQVEVAREEGVVARYGVRNLSSYTGPQVRAWCGRGGEADIFTDAEGRVTLVQGEWMAAESVEEWSGGGQVYVRTLYDQTGGGRHLVRQQGDHPLVHTSTHLLCVRMDGSRGHLRCAAFYGNGVGSAFARNWSGEITLEAVVRPYRLSSTGAQLFIDNNYNEGAVLLTEEGVEVNWGTDMQARHPYAMDTRRWYHIAATHGTVGTSYAVRAYVNGEQVLGKELAISSAETAYGPDDALVVGRLAAVDIVDVVVRDEALSLDRVREAFASSPIPRGVHAAASPRPSLPFLRYDMRLVSPILYDGPTYRLSRGAAGAEVEVDVHTDAAGAVTKRAGNVAAFDALDAATECVVTWYDQSGGGRHLVAAGAKDVAVVSGEAMAFDGATDGHLLLTDLYSPSGLEGTSPCDSNNWNGNCTYEMWLRPSSLPAGWGSYIFQDHNYNEGQVFFNDTGWGHNYATGNEESGVGTAPTLNAWHHVVYTHERDGVRDRYVAQLFVNGALISRTEMPYSTSAGWYGPDHNLTLARHAHVDIAHFSLYDYVLDAADVASRHARGMVQRLYRPISSPPTSPRVCASTRLLLPTWKGPTMRLRRGTEEVDAFTDEGGRVVRMIGTSLLPSAWLAQEGDIFVTRVYDQTGGGMDLSSVDPTRDPRYLPEERALNFARHAVQNARNNVLLQLPANISARALGMIRSGTILLRHDPREESFTARNVLSDFRTSGGMTLRLVSNGVVEFYTYPANNRTNARVAHVRKISSGLRWFAAVLREDRSVTYVDHQMVGEVALTQDIGHGITLRLGDQSSHSGEATEGLVTDLLIFSGTLEVRDMELLTTHITPTPLPSPSPGAFPSPLRPLAVAAYSTRRLFSEYDGPSVLVRREGDGALANVWCDADGRLVGSDDAILASTLSLQVWSGGSGVVAAMWYDQGEGGRHQTAAHHAALSAPTFGADGVDGGLTLSFDGVSQGMSAGDVMRSLSGMTAVAAFRTRRETVDQFLVGKHHTGTSGSWYLAAHQAIMVNTAAQRVNLVFWPTQRWQNEWRAAHFTYDGGRMRTFIDGAAGASAAQSGASRDTADALSVGAIVPRTAAPYWFYEGSMREAVVVDRALVSSAILTTASRGGARDALPYDVSSTCFACYALRRVFVSYDGPTVRVQRSTDYRLADVWMDDEGAVARVVEVDGGRSFPPQLEAWRGVGALEVAVWYDQSGSGRHQTATESGHATFALPSLSLDPADGKWCITFDGATQGLCAKEGEGVMTQVFAAAVFKTTSNANNEALVSHHRTWTDGSWYLGTYRNAVVNNSDTRVNNDARRSAGWSGEWRSLSFSYDRQMVRTFVDGMLSVSSSLAVDIKLTSHPLSVGVIQAANGGGTTWFFDGSMREVFAFTSSLPPTSGLTWQHRLLSSPRTPGAMNIGWGLFESNTVGAYATRKLFAPYEGPQVRVRRGSDSVQADVWMDASGRVRRVVEVTGSVERGGDLEAWRGGEAVVLHVVQWYDQGPKGNHVTQSTNAAQPALARREGRYWAKFDGAQWLERVDADDFNIQEMTVHVRTVCTGTATEWQDVVSKILDGNERTFVVWFGLDASSIAFERSTATNLFVNARHYTSYLNKVLDVTGRYHATSGLFETWNGTAQLATSTRVFSVPTNSAKFTIGGNGIVHSRFKGETEHVCVFDSIVSTPSLMEVFDDA